MEALGRDGGSPGLENRLQDGDWGVVYTVQWRYWEEMGALHGLENRLQDGDWGE